MKKKGAELITIFLSSMVLFCSLSFPVYAAQNDWGYNDSYINSVSSENKELFFIPPAPDSEYTDYMIVYFEDDYYLVLGSGDFLLFGAGAVQRPSPVVCFIYTESSNNWESCNFPNTVFDMPAFGRSMVVIDVTSNLEFWGAGDPIQEKPITNYTGYRLFWNLSLILQTVLNWVINITNLILDIILLRYLCITALAGEFIVFCVIILRKVGEIRNEENIL